MADRNYWQLAEHFRKRCNELQARLDEVLEKYSEHVRTTDHWLRRIQRLQTLQPDQVTAQEQEAVNDQLPHLLLSKRTIAAVCRGMTQETKGE